MLRMPQFLTTDIAAVFGIILFANFIQGLSGFGLGLTAMPLLISSIGLATAAPLMAVVGLVIGLIMLIVYREALSVKAVLRLLVMAVPGIPVGVFVLARANEVLVTAVLGVVVAGYALYALVGPRVPKLENENWSYPIGFLSGMLSGAFNTSGPPVIIYGQLRQWPPDEFKSNLQAFFQVLGVLVVLTHALSGNLTPDVWRYFWVSLPAILLGGGIGIILSRFINPAGFRKVVLIMLVILGLRLMLP